MTTATFTPPERWPFLAGEAVYYLPSGNSRIHPSPLIPAIVLACHQMRSCPSASVSIRRDDKSRPASVSAHSLAYRGYCEVCEVPAIVGDANMLICPRCGDAAIALPPPDHLIVRWFPLECWSWPMLARCQYAHPTWPRSAVREAVDTPHDDAYADMLRRMQLRQLYHSDGGDRRRESRLLGILKAAAILRDDALFLATHQELRAYQAETDRSKYLAHRLRKLSPERLEMLLDLAEGDGPPQPPAVSLIPLPERPESNAEPDGEDETTRWLEQQFKKKRTA